MEDINEKKVFYDIPTLVPDENGDVVLLNKKSISPLEFSIWN